MSAVRPSNLGATRTCPHCKATVLASALICPGCQHHLRFNPSEATNTAGAAGYSALEIDASFQHKTPEQACEYCVVLTVADAKGQRIARGVVNVGALSPAESRSIKLSVELIPRGPGAAKRS